MRSILAVLTVAATAVTLTATPASAASGSVIIRTLGEATWGIGDPRPSECHDLGPGFHAVINETDGPILVFPDNACDGEAILVHAWDNTEYGLHYSFQALT
ncbi:hypothetical protein [Nonomuraea jabiensis]|uniref:Uncharacterized protein n=1 Tax=Nonomuraea jabiensis TaxID=882448 RepID=A0A7W9GBT3_9ACTN|nr:hypothetical protein [Nonomuraea jabiensis]MBB5780879.1 hypothetical protein [Nonomuraea jabiensis]